MNKLQLILTVDEINTVLFALSQRPYCEVFELIDNVKTQATNQHAVTKVESGDI